MDPGHQVPNIERQATGWTCYFAFTVLPPPAPWCRCLTLAWRRRRLLLGAPVSRYWAAGAAARGDFRKTFVLPWPSSQSSASCLFHRTRAIFRVKQQRLITEGVRDGLPLQASHGNSCGRDPAPCLGLHSIIPEPKSKSVPNSRPKHESLRRLQDARANTASTPLDSGASSANILASTSVGIGGLSTRSSFVGGLSRRTKGRIPSRVLPVRQTGSADSSSSSSLAENARIG